MNHVRDLLDKRHVSITLTTEATDLLIEEGYDPVYGARPLKRVLQKRVVDPLALKLIQGEIRDGANVRVQAQAGELVFEVVSNSEPMMV